MLFDCAYLTAAAVTEAPKAMIVVQMMSRTWMSAYCRIVTIPANLGSRFGVRVSVEFAVW